VPLEPLSLDDVAEIVDSLGIDTLHGSTLAPTLLRHCGGNPLFLLETLKAWLVRGDVGARGAGEGVDDRSLPARLPIARSLRSVIERRIGRLSADAVRLARCAAVAAPDFSIELASHVLGVRTLDLADPCAELEAAQVLRDGAFAHDLIYEAALASVPAAVARQLHAEVAAFLQQRDGEPARLAHHWLQAGDDAQAGAAFMAAAERSRKASSLAAQSELLAEAARCFEHAGRPAERFDALLRRARTLASNDSAPTRTRRSEAVEAVAASDEQRLLALDARLELT
jgi:predicted ATPase